MRPPLPMILHAFVSGSLLSGCQGILWGNLAMLAVAVGIFMGTLWLGRE